MGQGEEAVGSANREGFGVWVSSRAGSGGKEEEDSKLRSACPITWKSGCWQRTRLGSELTGPAKRSCCDSCWKVREGRTEARTEAGLAQGLKVCKL